MRICVFGMSVCKMLYVEEHGVCEFLFKIMVAIIYNAVMCLKI